MNFLRFLDFSRDHSIFPTQCSKATLNKIFNLLAIQTTPQRSSSSVRNVSSINLSTSCYIDVEKDQSLVLDRRLFIQAVTLCALY